MFLKNVTNPLGGLSQYGVFDSFTDYPYGIFYCVFIFCKLPLNCNRFVRDRVQLKLGR